MVAALVKAGYYTNTAVFPAVSQGRGGVRITLTVHHTPADIRGSPRRHRPQSLTLSV